MRIAGLQKLSMVDYPGKMACTIFFAGCNFRCPYCHNSLLVQPEADHEWLEAEEVLSYLKKRQGILEGVCISGGEPLMQGETLIPFLEQIKALGYPVKLDTNGSFPELLKHLCREGLIDYVAMDVKHTKEQYGRWGDPLQETMDFLMAGTVEYEFRTTLVKGIHEKKDMEQICQWITGTKAWYLQNFKDSGNLLAPDQRKMDSFSESEIDSLKELARKQKIPVFVRNI